MYSAKSACSPSALNQIDASAASVIMKFKEEASLISFKPSKKYIFVSYNKIDHDGTEVDTEKSLFIIYQQYPATGSWEWQQGKPFVPTLS